MKYMAKNLIPAIEYSIQNPKTSMTKVAELFGVNRHKISKYKADNLYLLYAYENQSNPDDPNVYYFTDREKEIIDYYLDNPNIPYNRIKEKYPDAPERRAMYHWIEILGENKTEGGSIKYHYDRNKFKVIETEEDAYWLGFITADGCIIEHKWLAIQLAAEDKHHLEKFCHYMGMTDEEIQEIIKDGFGGAYTRDNPVNSIKICSLDIINNLQQYGIEPNKSGKEKPYICSTVALETAYVRGLIDGDGYLGSTQPRLGIVGSYEICSYVQNYINANIKDISNNHIREHGIIYKLEITGRNQSKQIIQHLYQNATIYLDRKYQLYLDQYND